MMEEFNYEKGSKLYVKLVNCNDNGYSIVLIGCSILVISGMIDAALKSAMMYVGLYIVIASVSCIIETIIKANQNTEEDDDE